MNPQSLKCVFTVKSNEFKKVKKRLCSVQKKKWKWCYAYYFTSWFKPLKKPGSESCWLYSKMLWTKIILSLFLNMFPFKAAVTEMLSRDDKDTNIF